MTDNIESEQLPLLSRDLSWVDFNERVLEEGLNKDLPLLERLRFLSIVSTNFDEFFMIRVAAMKRALHSGLSDPGLFEPYGISPAKQLKEINKKVLSIFQRQWECIEHEIFPGLASGGLKLLRPDSYSVPQMDYLESFFVKEIFPALTPLRIEDDKPLPFIESRAIYAAFLLEPENEVISINYDDNSDYLVIVKLPKTLSRIIWLPQQNETNEFSWALLDDVTLAWGAYLFPGYRIGESLLFKINRDADLSVDEQRDENFLEAMEEALEGREKSDVIRMVCSTGSTRIKEKLARCFSLENEDIY